MWQGRLLLAGLAAGLLLAPSLSVPSAAQVLITDQEAKLPPLPGAVAVTNRGITRGPKVELISPAKGKSPLRLQVKFSPFGGSTIDPDSVKVTYLKSPVVDLTSRVKPFTQPAGIDVPVAEVPQGDHLIRVDVKDSDGRTATTSFVLKVAP